jgi:hypothetical protein
VSIDTRVAAQLGNALAKGDFAQAHALLTEQAQNLYSPAAFEQEVKTMTAYAEGPVQEVEVMGTLDAWPDKFNCVKSWGRRGKAPVADVRFVMVNHHTAPFSNSVGGR